MSPSTPTPTLGDALAKAQAEFPPITRSRTVKVKTKTGGQYEFSYAPLDVILEAVRQPLANHGLAISQPLGEYEGKPVLETILLHSSGERLASKFPLPRVPDSPQELGSLITYLRRYALTAVLGIASEEDDDGNHASGNSSAPKASAPPAAPDEPKTAFQPPAGATADGGDTITDAQLRKMWATWRETQIPDLVLKKHLSDWLGVESTKQIPKAKFQELLDWIGAQDKDIPF